MGLLSKEPLQDLGSKNKYKKYFIPEEVSRSKNESRAEIVEEEEEGEETDEGMSGSNPFSMFLRTIGEVKKYFKSILTVYIEAEDFLIFKGDIPICLVAHMDTVFSTKPKEFPPQMRMYANSNILSAPSTGLGADDRAGCLGIDYILKSGRKPWVILTDGEERGCVGAKKLCALVPKSTLECIKFFIQLDRRGEKDCVFYDMDTTCKPGREFVNMLESYGFKETSGSSTDIRHLAPHFGIAATNLSIGYTAEHTHHETLNWDWWRGTLLRVCNILDDHDKLPFFKYSSKAEAVYNRPKHWQSSSPVSSGRQENVTACGDPVSDFYIANRCVFCWFDITGYEKSQKMHLTTCNLYGFTSEGKPRDNEYCNCPKAHLRCVSMVCWESSRARQAKVTADRVVPEKPAVAAGPPPGPAKNSPYPCTSVEVAVQYTGTSAAESDITREDEAEISRAETDGFPPRVALDVNPSYHRIHSLNDEEYQKMYGDAYTGGL
jgi:hypothetical protein